MKYYDDKRGLLSIAHDRFNVSVADLTSMYGEYLDPMCDQTYAVLYKVGTKRESIGALRSMLRIHSYKVAR